DGHDVGGAVAVEVADQRRRPLRRRRDRRGRDVEVVAHQVVDKEGAEGRLDSQPGPAGRADVDRDAVGEGRAVPGAQGNQTGPVAVAVAVEVAEHGGHGPVRQDAGEGRVLGGQADLVLHREGPVAQTGQHDDVTGRVVADGEVEAAVVVVIEGGEGAG